MPEAQGRITKAERNPKPEIRNLTWPKHGEGKRMRENWLESLKWLLLGLCFSGWGADTQRFPGGKASGVRDHNTPRDFPVVVSAKEWQIRAREIREQVLVSCGLWPMPEKTPLQAHIFGRIERDGYSVEKVYLQPLSGFYLGGNLYRPLGRGNGPFPGILNPHGHWNEGRLADTKDGSIPARCISFARQGMVALSYDMVGFNDTHFAGGRVA